MSALVAVVAALAVYRFTILVVADEITAPLRDRAVRALNERKHGTRPEQDVDAWRAHVAVNPHRVAFALTCPWCASPYVAAPIVAWTVLADPGRVWWLVCGTAAASGAAAFLATKASP